MACGLFFSFFFLGPLLVCPTEHLPSSGALTFKENEGLSRRTSDSQQLNNSSGLVSPLSTTSLGLTSVCETLQRLRGSFTSPLTFSSADLFLLPLLSPSSSPLVCSLQRWSQPIIHLHLSLSSASLVPINFISSFTMPYKSALLLF